MIEASLARLHWVENAHVDADSLEMVGHGMMSGSPVAGGNRVDDLFVMIAMRLGELFHANSPIGAVPFPLPDRTASGTREMTQEGDEDRIACNLGDRLMKSIIRTLAFGAISCGTSVGDVQAQQGNVLRRPPHRGSRCYLRFK